MSSFSVGLGVEWCLVQEDGVFLWCHTELIVEDVMPNFLHAPVDDDAVFKGVLEGDDTLFCAGHRLLHSSSSLPYPNRLCLK